MRKVSIIGTHSTGKTTAAYKLCTELKLHNKPVTLVAEVASTSPLLINESSSPEQQLWILVTQISRELEASHKTEYVVCDRSVLDTLAYFTSARNRNGQNLYPNIKYDSIKRLTFDWLSTYDCLILVVPDGTIPLVADGIRSVNEDYQQEIYQELLQLLSEFKIERPELAEKIKFLEVTPNEMFDDYVVNSIIYDLSA